MNKFTSDLIVKSYNATKWELTEQFYFYFEDPQGLIEIIVPEGFVTDFASVPRLFWSIFPPTGKYTKAAVLHDFLYSNNSILRLNRTKCDQMFLKGMEVLGVSKPKRYIMFLAVRLFGFIHYKKT